MRLSDCHLKFQKELQTNDIDVACLLKPHNVFYFAGYASVCSGVLIFPEGDAIFCILWLDAQEAKRFCTLSNIVGYKFPQERLGGRMIDLIKKREPRPNCREYHIWRCADRRRKTSRSRFPYRSVSDGFDDCQP